MPDRLTMPGAMSAETAERRSDHDPDALPWRRGKNRLVIDLEAHQRAMRETDEAVAALTAACRDVLDILKADNDEAAK